MSRSSPSTSYVRSKKNVGTGEPPRACGAPPARSWTVSIDWSVGASASWATNVRSSGSPLTKRSCRIALMTFAGGSGWSARFIVAPGAIVITWPSLRASRTRNRLVERWPTSISLVPGPALPSIICTVAGAGDACRFGGGVEVVVQEPLRLRAVEAGREQDAVRGEALRIVAYQQAGRLDRRQRRVLDDHMGGAVDR